jgi:carbamoyltransferase
VTIRGPIALGLHWAHDAAVSVCTPDGILFSVAEERLVRTKHYYGFPMTAIRTALTACGLTGADVDLFAFSARKPFFPHHRHYRVVSMAGLESEVFDPEAVGKPGPVVSEGMARPGKPLDRQWEGFASRHWAQYTQELEALGFFHPRMRCYYVEHHRAHAASAFRLSGMDEACVLTLDGKGDNLCATISHGHSDGRMDVVRVSPKEASLGAFYQAVTEALGFVPVDGEFKTMGLAAAGEGFGGVSPFAGTVRVVDGVLQSTTEWTYRNFNEAHPEKAVNNPLSSVTQAEEYEALLETMSPQQMAYCAQSLCEDVMLEFARQGLALTGARRLACAGGVMLNVKANGRILQTLGLMPDDYFVFPDAADSGLAAGAAMEALFQEGALSHAVALATPYLGPEYGEEEMCEALDRPGLQRTNGGANSADVLAGHLADGLVVGTFQGRLEMGPRALGNRSVLADPRDVAVKQRINGLLKGREWFVPFAPIVLEEDAHLYWDGSLSYPYMTFAVAATPYARECVPAVVHLDGTLRPQVVTRASNPWLHEVLLAFRARTGVGVLINTSFNRHGHPIVCAPKDAVMHLENGWVDALAMGPWFVTRQPV